MKSKLKQNVFYQYVLSYGLILLIPVLMIVGMGTSSLRQKQREVSDLSERALSLSVENMESRFEEISNLTQLITTNENLAAAVNGEGYYARYQLFKDLEKYCYANSFIQNIYVFFEADDQVVGNDGIITNKEYFYRMKYDLGPEHYQKWLEEQWDWQNFSGSLSSDELRTSFDETERMIQYAWPVYQGNGQERRSARILIYISEAKLRSLINQVSGMENFSIQMQGSESVIFLGNAEIGEGSQEGLLTLSKTADSGRIYSCSIVRDNIFREWYNQLIFSIVFMAAACVLCGLMSYYFARRNSAPIVNILELLNKGADGRGPGEQGVFDYLQGRVSDILKDRQQLQAELERRIPLLQVSFVERLLSGTLPDYSGLEEQLANLRITLKGEFYSVAVLQIVSCPEEGEAADSKPFSAARIVVEHAVYKAADCDLYIYSMDNELVTVILAVSETQLEDGYPASLCRRVAEDTLKEHGVQLAFAVGRPYPALADIFLSYIQAKKLLEAPDGKGEAPLNGEGLSTSGYFYYPLELEQKLIRVTLSGSGETIRSIFDELQEENLKIRHLTSSMYQRLLEELQGTFVKVLAPMQDNRYPTGPLEEVLGVPSFSDTQQNGLEVFRQLFLEAAGIVRTSKEGKAADYKKRIASYMKEHYTDPNMSLGMLSDYFSVTEVYMSKLFKENMGMLFSQYLEDLRMERAEELLRHSQVSIGEVAESCGYQSPHAFRRAYKRHYGLLPSDARKES